MTLAPEPAQHTAAERLVVPPGLLRRFLDNGERQDSLVLEIAEQIAQEIITSTRLPGSDLNSVDLSTRFSTSRTPIREALGLLEREGLVELPARRRPRVAGLDTAQIESAYLLLGQLYGVISERVANCSDSIDIDRVAEHMAVMQQAADNDDVARYFWANVDFHDTCGELARDPLLKRTVDSLGLRVLRFRYLTLALPGQLTLSAQDHARLVRAFREEDSELAGALARSLVRSSLRALKSSLI
ncbi:GntR family transcriptional regulator [Nocardia sp. CA2R105]|uniref:GntR family transcriptional regulator n=1 Tax=Nocardia coffeae TaxID=2873381 RepID=UPI001CA60B65|nr:GntR family transcriptional regulator [Nocardia coffeae]MBY8862334.1 GntR family transcriptional regulator [Nocardia coffeae]